MSVLHERIELTINEKVHQVHEQFRCLLYGTMRSHSLSNLQKYADSIRDLGQLSVYSSQQLLSDVDFQSTDLQQFTVELVEKYGSVSIQMKGHSFITSGITAIAEKLEIGVVIANFADVLCERMKIFTLRTNTHVCAEKEHSLLEATGKILTSVLSDVIRRRQRKITQSLMFGLRKEAFQLFRSKFSFQIGWRNFLAHHTRSMGNYTPQASHMLAELKDLKKTRGMYMQSMMEAKLVSEYFDRNIIIFDLHKGVIIETSPHRSDKTIQRKNVDNNFFYFQSGRIFPKWWNYFFIYF